MDYTNQTAIIRDKINRRIEIRPLNAAETMRVLSCIPAGTHDAFVFLICLITQVRRIDDEAIKLPTTLAQLDKLIERVGESGAIAIADLLRRGADVLSAIGDDIIKRQAASEKPASFQWIKLQP